VLVPVPVAVLAPLAGPLLSGGKLLLALLLGGLCFGLGWLLARRPVHRDRLLLGLRRAQLLRWIDAAPAGWLIVDPADAVHLLNRRAERLLQVPGASLLRLQPLEEICAAAQLRELIHVSRRQDRPQRLEWQVGDQELELVAIPGDQGWVVLHLQSRRSLEAQLEQQERWVSDVAHELKTPLTALLLVGDSLAAEVNSRNAVLVERLLRELRRLQQLVGDLLELSRLENTLPGGGGVRREPVDLVLLLDQVWQGLRPLADQRGIDLQLLIDPVEAPAVVLGDASRLHRALLNLLDNGVRYSPDGGRLQVRLRPGPRWCLLSVRDSGPGLSEEDLEHLFERFYRGDPSRVRSSQGGSGLGLSIVQRIALTHGGRVQAGNHPDGGALLELLLPVGS
jgi:two-component system phosphate regulon sensor histidine kinase PhoR